MSDKIEGLIAAPYTPLDASGEVDLGKIGAQAESLHKNGVKGGFVCGTSGEGPSLTSEERMSLVAEWTRTAPDGFKVIAHAGHASVAEARRLAAHAAEVGTWAVAAQAPYYNKPRDVSMLVDFLARVAEAAPELPFYYYHIPSWTGFDCSLVEFLSRAGERIPNFVGVKYTNSDLQDFRQGMVASDGRHDLLFGCDELLIFGLTAGARGAVGSTFNYAAPLYLELIEAFDKGNLERARRLQDQSMEMVRILYNVPDCDFIGVARAALKIVGMDCGPARSPIKNPTPEQVKKLEVDLREIGFFYYCSQ